MLLYATLTVQKENQIFAVSLRPVPLLCHNVHNSQSGSQRQLKADRIALHSFEKSSFSAGLHFRPVYSLWPWP